MRHWPATSPSVAASHRSRCCLRRLIRQAKGAQPRRRRRCGAEGPTIRLWRESGQGVQPLPGEPRRAYTAGELRGSRAAIAGRSQTLAAAIVAPKGGGSAWGATAPRPGAAGAGNLVKSGTDHGASRCPAASSGCG